MGRFSYLAHGFFSSFLIVYKEQGQWIQLRLSLTYNTYSQLYICKINTFNIYMYVKFFWVVIQKASNITVRFWVFISSGKIEAGPRSLCPDLRLVRFVLLMPPEIPSIYTANSFSPCFLSGWKPQSHCLPGSEPVPPPHCLRALPAPPGWGWGWGSLLEMHRLRFQARPIKSVLRFGEVSIWAQISVFNKLSVNLTQAQVWGPQEQCPMTIPIAKESKEMRRWTGGSVLLWERF